MPQHNQYITFAETLHEELAQHRTYKPNTPSEIVDSLAVKLGYDEAPHVEKIDHALLSAICLLATQSASAPDNLWRLALRLDNEPTTTIAPSDELEAKILRVMLGLVKMYRAYKINPLPRYNQIVNKNQHNSAFLMLGIDAAT